MAIRCSLNLSGFHGDESSLTTPPLVRERGILIHPVVMETILGEFLADSSFPLSCDSFLSDEGSEGNDFQGNGSLLTATRPKQMYAATLRDSAPLVF